MGGNRGIEQRQSRDARKGIEFPFSGEELLGMLFALMTILCRRRVDRRIALLRQFSARFQYMDSYAYQSKGEQRADQ